MLEDPVKILFVSRRNSARSVLAQACLESLAKGRFKAYSCGTPKHVEHAVHPSALKALASVGMKASSETCRSWDTYARGSARPMDFVITLDEGVAANAPKWPGQPETALWSYPDVVVAGDLGTDTHDAMVKTLYSLRRRLELLVSLPMRGVDRGALRNDVRDIAYMR